MADRETMEDEEEAQARLWPLAAEFPGPALEAVLAALPRAAKRCLRATCTAARAAVDARLTSLDATKDQALLLAPRLSRLRRLQCRGVAADEVLAALPLLPATLTRLQLNFDADAPLPSAQFDALVAAIAACSSLESLELSAGNLFDNPEALAALGGRLPALTEFELNFVEGKHLPTLSEFGLSFIDDEFQDEPPVLQLPWHQLQKLRLSGDAAALLPQLLAREAPKLRSLELGSDGTLDVRALSGAPWFTQLTRLDLDCRKGPGTAALFAGATAQLALEELQQHFPFGGAPLAAVHRLAATAMPLRRLQLARPAVGVMEAIAGAPWASSLQALQMHDGAEFGTPAATGAAAAALAGAPLGALTSLELVGVQFGEDAAPLSMLLAAPWAPGLRKLVIGAPFGTATFDAAAVAAAAAALAAAPLPALRVLDLQDLRLDAAALSDALAAAPWLQRLEELTLFDCIFSPEAFAALAAVDMPSLAQLAVGSNFLSAQALQALAAAPWLLQLQRLRLTGFVPPAAHRACLDELSKACSPYSALLERGGEIDTARSRGIELRAE